MCGSEPSAITAIEPQARAPDRVSIFVDGEFAAGVHAEVAAAAGLRVGQAITATELVEVLHDEERRKARESAFVLLGHRARTRSELKMRLVRKGFDAALVEETLESLERSRLVDDEEFTRSWIRARTGSRPMGPVRIAAELRQKGVDRELVEEGLQALDRDRILDLALIVGRQKAEQLRGEDVRTARRKLGNTLLRRGFSWDICASVMDIVLRSDE